MQVLLHYFWDSPGFGIRLKTKRHAIGFVVRIPSFKLALLLNSFMDKKFKLK